MKEAELRKLATCAICKKLLGNCGMPVFYKVTIERFMLDVQAVNRQAGVEMIVGHPAIAAAMGPDEDLAQSLYAPRTVMVCNGCSLDKDGLVQLLHLNN